MNFHALSPEATANIVSQIEALLGAFSFRSRLGTTELPERLGLFESCREIILDLPDDWPEILRAQESNFIEQWLRPQATWYHQLRTNQRPFGFARSIEEENLRGGREHRVIEVVPSAVADEFQETIRIIDETENKDFSESEATAVLLFVPRYAFYGLANLTPGVPTHSDKKEISLVYPFFRKRLGECEQRLRRGPLLSFLESLPSAFGVLGPRTEG